MKLAVSARAETKSNGFHARHSGLISETTKNGGRTFPFPGAMHKNRFLFPPPPRRLSIGRYLTSAPTVAPIVTCHSNFPNCAPASYDSIDTSLIVPLPCRISFPESRYTFVPTSSKAHRTPLIAFDYFTCIRFLAPRLTSRNFFKRAINSSKFISTIVRSPTRAFRVFLPTLGHVALSYAIDQTRSSRTRAPATSRLNPTTSLSCSSSERTRRLRIDSPPLPLPVSTRTSSPRAASLRPGFEISTG